MALVKRNSVHTSGYQPLTEMIEELTNFSAFEVSIIYLLSDQHHLVYLSLIDQGLCQTFNGKHLDKIIKPSSWLDLFNHDFRTKVIVH